MRSPPPPPGAARAHGFLCGQCGLTSFNYKRFHGHQSLHTVSLHTQSRFQVHLHYTWSSRVKPANHNWIKDERIIVLISFRDGRFCSFKRLNLAGKSWITKSAQYKTHCLEVLTDHLLLKSQRSAVLYFLRKLGHKITISQFCTTVA